MVSIDYVSHEILSKEGVEATENEKVFLDTQSDCIIIVKPDGCLLIKF